MNCHKSIFCWRPFRFVCLFLCFLQGQLLLSASGDLPNWLVGQYLCGCDLSDYPGTLNLHFIYQTYFIYQTMHRYFNNKMIYNEDGSGYRVGVYGVVDPVPYFSKVGWGSLATVTLVGVTPGLE